MGTHRVSAPSGRLPDDGGAFQILQVVGELLGAGEHPRADRIGADLPGEVDLDCAVDRGHLGFVVSRILAPREDSRKRRTPACSPIAALDVRPRVSAGLGWQSLVGAELIVASSGIGYLMVKGQSNISTATVMSGMIAIGIVGVIIDIALRALEALDAAGTAAVGNTGSGIAIWSGAANNIIGTNLDGSTEALEGNVIAGSGADGITIADAGTSGNLVRGNLIGVTTFTIQDSQNLNFAIAASQFWR